MMQDSIGTLESQDQLNELLSPIMRPDFGGFIADLCNVPTRALYTTYKI